MAWKLAPAISALKDAVLAKYPATIRGSDYVGTIGDARHAAGKSEHNPDPHGYVCALDIGFTSETLDDAYVRDLLTSPDHRLWYIISDGKIWSRTHNFVPRRYTGPNPHTGHVHVSVRTERSSYMDGRPWRLGGAPGGNAIGKGSPADAIKRLQGGMRDTFPAYAGALAVDGVWGPRTEQAVREFQRRTGLAADGIVGPATRAKLAEFGVRL